MLLFQLQLKKDQLHLEEEAAKNQRDNDVFLAEIQHFKEKLSADKATRTKKKLR